MTDKPAESKVSTATWRKVIERHGKVVRTTTGPMEGDPFAALAGAVWEHTKAGYACSHVSVSLGNSAEFGAMKVSVSINMPVPTTEGHINFAGEIGFIQAHHMINEASAALGLTPLG